MVHATSLVAGDLVALIKVVVLLYKTQAKHPHFQVLVLSPSSFLTSIGLIELTLDAKGKTCLTVVAIRPVGK